MIENNIPKSSPQTVKSNFPWMCHFINNVNLLHPTQKRYTEEKRSKIKTTTKKKCRKWRNFPGLKSGDQAIKIESGKWNQAGNSNSNVSECLFLANHRKAPRSWWRPWRRRSTRWNGATKRRKRRRRMSAKTWWVLYFLLRCKVPFIWQFGNWSLRHLFVDWHWTWSFTLKLSKISKIRTLKNKFSITFSCN